MAVTDNDELSLLRQEYKSLHSAQAQNEELDQAENRQAKSVGALEQLHKQLSEIPQNHQRPPQEVETEMRQIEAAGKSKAEEKQNAGRLLEEMNRQQTTWAAQAASRDAAEKESGLWKKLAEALGAKGLEAKIVQSALAMVTQNANRTLQSLSNGAFAIELEDDKEKAELQIFVSDVNTGEKRLFEYFSGGERMLIAVSLAVAIGQTMHGQNAANTLIIDEGFGALDDSRRALMVDELHRLSQDVLRGGRVIVVSHQDDVKEKFPHRYLLGKDAEGYAKVNAG